MINEIRKSAGYLTRAASAVFSPSYRIYSLGPLLANCVLFSLAIYWSWTAVTGWIDGWAGGIQLWSWLGWLQGAVDYIIEALKILLLLIIIIILASFFTSVVHLLAAPLLGLLAEKVDFAITSHPLPDETVGQLVRRTIGRELHKIRYWLTRAVLVLVVAFVIGLVPGINVIAPFIWTLFAGWMMAIQYIDFAGDVRAIPFPEVIRRLKARRVLVLSFGLIVLGITMLPPFNLFILPVAVIAGVTLWHQELASAGPAGQQQAPGETAD